MPAPVLEAFRNSFHARHCLHSPTRIEVLRKEANQQAQSLIAGETAPEVQPLDTKEEVALLRYYQHRLKDICGRFKLPPSVEPLAQWFLLRLSLRTSFMLVDGKYVMVICVLIASKCEGIHDAASRFLREISNLSKDKLIQGEYEVLQVLEHRVHFYPPLDALLGLLLIWRSLVSPTNKEINDDLEKSICNTLREYYATDALIYLHPSHLALCSLVSHITEGQYQLLASKINIPLPPFIEIVDLARELKEHGQQCTFTLPEVSAIDLRIIQIRKARLNKLTP